MHSLSGNDANHFEQEQMGHIQMLQKSHQLLLMASFLFLSAAVAAAYEAWNLANTAKECNMFIPGEPVVNEIFRLIARITWLYIPSWLIIYVFWIWPNRPRKFVSESSEMRRRMKRLDHLRARNRCLNTVICCQCCKYPEYGSASSTPRTFDFEDSGDGDEKRQRLISHDADGQLALSEDDRERVMNGSMAHHNGHSLQNGEEHAQIYSLQKTMVREESSSSMDSTDSMGQSDIWDQQPTTQNVTSPHAMSRSVTRQSNVSPQHRFMQR